MVFSILPKNERNSLFLSKEGALDSEFRSFFGRIEDTINCFRDLLTFSIHALFKMEIEDKCTTFFFVCKSFYILAHGGVVAQSLTNALDPE